jgi:hypothetical protein
VIVEHERDKNEVEQKCRFLNQRFRTSCVEVILFPAVERHRNSTRQGHIHRNINISQPLSGQVWISRHHDAFLL